MPKTPLCDNHDHTQSHEILKKLYQGTSQAPWQTRCRLRRRPASSSITQSRRYLLLKLCRAYPLEDSSPNFVAISIPHLHPNPDETLLLSSIQSIMQVLRLVLQGTSVVASDNHPVHFHGYNFYVVGWGFGNFDPKKDPHKYILVDPPQETTVGVPKNGWVALSFKADNLGLFFKSIMERGRSDWPPDESGASIDGEEVVELAEEDISKSFRVCAKSLIGRIFADRIFSVGTMENAMEAI
ncbi:hypothetical protein PIB30_055850 [Stylosanthes scabra]|uniref:Plastocyanin-like domain-containing protein n=1 Tax=Stylosanthes scabra TaxID=79078 RepID=A0ABU6RJ35_9FABA|nr:hypothetical protein [Stylosanthes scabra]